MGEIVDLRTSSKNSFGNIYGINQSEKSPFYLPNGNLEYLKRKLDTELKVGANPYKINLALIQLQLDEKIKSATLANGTFKFEGAFFTMDGFDSTVIFPFKYNVAYTRKLDDQMPLYALLDSKLKDLQQRLEVYFFKNYGKNYKLARHVVVKTRDFRPADFDNDTLYFFQRKINFSDFTLKQNSNSRFAAAIFTSMGYIATPKMIEDTVFIDFTTKVYQIKGMSWAIPQADNTNSLNHEQTHFNITQLIAEKFKERLRDEALPPTNYDSRIQYLYLEYFRKINKLQNQYDIETQHGINREKQLFWENFIKEELVKFGVNV